MPARKTARRRGTVRARGTDRWEVVATVKDPLTGTHRKVSRAVRGSRRDAEARLSQLLVELEDGSLTPRDAPSTGSYAELLDQWLDRKRAEGLSPSTLARYRHAADVLKVRLGSRRLDQIDTASIDSLFASLLRSGQSPATIAKISQVARSSLGLAVTYGLIRSNPALAAKAPKVLKPVTDAPEPETVKAIIEAADAQNHTLATFIRVGAATGARRGELCALKWSDLSLDDEVPSALIGRTVVLGDDGVLERSVTKTGKARRVTLDHGTVAALRAQRAKADSACEKGGFAVLRDGWVFSSQPDGSAIPRPDSFTAAFSQIAKRLGIKVTLYEATRHFAASTMIGNGIDPTTAAARLGHDATTLLKRYSHVRAGADAKAAGLVGASLD